MLSEYAQTKRNHFVRNLPRFYSKSEFHTLSKAWILRTKGREFRSTSNSLPRIPFAALPVHFKFLGLERDVASCSSTHRRSNDESCTKVKISKGPCHRCRRHTRQNAGDRAKRLPKISIWPHHDPAQDGPPGKKVGQRLEVRLCVARLSRPHH